VLPISPLRLHQKPMDATDFLIPFGLAMSLLTLSKTNTKIPCCSMLHTSVPKVLGLTKLLVVSLVWEARKSILARAASMNLLLHTFPRLDTDSHIRIHHFVQDERDISIHGDPKSTQTIQRTCQSLSTSMRRHSFSRLQIFYVCPVSSILHWRLSDD
jgi:hypothetical protein